MGNHDGKVVISAALDNSGLVKDVGKVEGSLGGLKTVARSASGAIQTALSSGFSKPVAAAQARINDLERQFKTVSIALKDAMLADDNAAAERAGNKQVRIYDQLEAAREKLRIAVEEEARKQARAEEKEAQKAAKEQIKNTKELGKNFGATEKAAKRFGMRLRGIVSGALVFNLISQGLRNVTDYFGRALKTNKAFSAEVAQLKAALLTAFQPIYSYVAPALINFIRLLTAAAQIVAEFFATLGGKSLQSSAIAAENLYKEAESIEAVGGAAKKASKSFAGFDEINTLQDQSAQGGGGSVSTTEPDFTSLKNAGISAEMENIKAKLKDILQYVPLITTGILGWKLGSFIADLLTANTEATTLKETIKNIGNKLSLAVGITLAVTGIVLETKGVVDAIKEGLNKVNVTEIVTGAVGIILGGALIGQFFGSAFLGGAIGAIVAGIPMVFAGVWDAIKNGIDWLSALLIAGGTTLIGGGIGFLIGGPLGALIGAGIGLIVGAITDLVIYLTQNWDEIKEKFGQWLAKAIVDIALWCSKAWDSIVGFFTNLRDSIVGFFKGIIDWVKNNWKSIVLFLINPLAGVFNYLYENFEGFRDFVDTVVGKIAGFFTNLWDGFKKGAKAAWNGVKEVFNKVGSFFGDIFSKAWSNIVKVFSVSGEIFVNIKDGILSAFKKIVNGIISGLNKVIKVPFDGINLALKKVRDINIAGAKPFGGIRLINVPQIPYLAQGAVLPPNKPFMAVVGDQRHGTNVEAPLATIQEALANVLASQGTGDITINFTGDLAQLARVLKPVIERENHRVGTGMVRKAGT